MKVTSRPRDKQLSADTQRVVTLHTAVADRHGQYRAAGAQLRVGDGADDDIDTATADVWCANGVAAAPASDGDAAA